MAGNGKIRLGEWVVEPALDRISQGGTRVTLQPHVMDLLVYLAHHSSEVISVDDLLSNLWEGKVVTSSSVYVGLMELRKALGDDARDPCYIRTIPKRGYRLIAEVEFEDERDSSTSPESIYVRKSTPGQRWFKATLMVLVLVLAAYAGSIFHERATQTQEPMPASAPTKSVAVLPFADMSPQQDQGWFSDGIAEEILNKLAHIPGLKVTGRSSSFAFREPVADIQAIGRTLGVAHLLEGSVRRDGNKVRVTAQLLRAEDGFHVWSQEYDREEMEILSIQDDISTNIANALKLKIIDEAVQAETAARGPLYPSFTAYELYLKARADILQGTSETLLDAVAKLERALQLEPEYADAHVAMVEAQWKLARLTFKPGQKVTWHKLARPHIESALAIDPNHAGAYLLRGIIYQDIDATEREASVRRAIALNANLALAHVWLGNMSNRDSGLWTWAEAIPHFEKALEIDPLSVEASTYLVKYLVFIQHRQDEVKEIIGNLKSRYPDHPQVGLVESDWLTAYGRVAESVPVLERAITNNPENNRARIDLSTVWYTIGEYERARQSAVISRPWHWALFPDREAALREVETFEGRWIYFSAYIYTMLREWQSALNAVRQLQAAQYSDLHLHDASNYSPGISMATAYKKLGHMKKAMELVEGEWKVLNIKSENAKYHSFQYSVVAARLYALEGRYYESMHELERLITLGPNDPREMVHPAYDEMRAEPEFTRLLELQRQRMNTERAKLGLTALSPDDMSRLATLNQTP